MFKYNVLSRMGELEGLNTKYKECMQNVEKLRMDLR